MSSPSSSSNLSSSSASVSSDSSFSSSDFSPSLSSSTDAAASQSEAQQQQEEDEEEVVELDTATGQHERPDDAKRADLMRDLQELAAEAAAAFQAEGDEDDGDDEDIQTTMRDFDEQDFRAFLMSPGSQTSSKKGGRQEAEEEDEDEADEEEEGELSFQDFMKQKLFGNVKGSLLSNATRVVGGYGQWAAMGALRYGWIMFSGAALMTIPFLIAHGNEIARMEHEYQFMALSNNAAKAPSGPAVAPADSTGAPGYSAPPAKLGGNAAGIPSQ